MYWLLIHFHLLLNFAVFSGWVHLEPSFTPYINVPECEQQALFERPLL